MTEFHLDGKEYIHLNSLLKLLKLVASGGEANVRIENKEVIVNGTVETRKRHKLRPGYVVIFDGNEITIT